MSNHDGATVDRGQRLEELRQAHRAALTAGDIAALEEIQVELDGLMTPALGTSPEDRAARYRQRAAFAREQAETETNPALREQLFGEAEGYDDLAKGIE